MAVVSTGAIYKSLIFDGEDSRDYGVYISGEAVYNAPERDVEMVAIPGRNGAFALDKGRFENIEVTYPAGIFADNETDFAEAISDFRNFLCSRNGYVRLEDEYNPNEYRMAIYKSGLEVSPTQLMTGEFEIIFECKPQRWLKSGEEAVTVESGDTLTNPTLFASSPLLMVEGDGSINWGDGVITINNDPIGDIVVHGYTQDRGVSTKEIKIDDAFALSGDVISVGRIEFDPTFSYDGTRTSYTTSFNGDIFNAGVGDIETGRIYFFVDIGHKNFAHGTPATYSGTALCSVTTSEYGTLTATITVSLAYNGSDTFTVSVGATTVSHIAYIQNSQTPSIIVGDIVLHSTDYSAGNPLYIDLEIGEAYKFKDSSAVSVNNAVSIPTELSKLASGANEITFDNTITDLKVVPRWWKV